MHRRDVSRERVYRHTGVAVPTNTTQDDYGAGQRLGVGANAQYNVQIPDVCSSIQCRKPAEAE